MSEKVIVAHRGGAFLGPENTLSCISKGMEVGAEWIEIKRSKNSLPGIEKACIDCSKEHGMLGQVVFQSFDDEVIETVHELCPEMRVEKLVTIPFLFNFRKYPYAASINPCHTFTTPAFIRRAHRHGKEVKVWTLNKYKKSLFNAVDGIITNDPGMFLE